MSKKDSSEDEKQTERDKTSRASFIQRVIAFVIDMFLVSMIASFIAFPFVDTEAVQELETKLQEAEVKVLEEQTDMESFVADSVNLTYSVANKTSIATLILLFVDVIYFIIYQFKNGGQTLGKKVMKIRVVSLNNQLSMDQMLVRTLIINSLLVDMLLFALLLFNKAYIYYYGALVFEGIQYAVLFVSALMVAFGKGRGVHDLIAHTEVVKEKIMEEF